MPVMRVVHHLAIRSRSTASSQTSSILNGQSLADVANWADQVKSNPAYSWSYGYHFVDTPDWACNFDYSRDCADDSCVVGAIANYTKRLQSYTGSEQEVALKFVIHFVGDVHQPLHCGFTSDKGMLAQPRI